MKIHCEEASEGSEYSPVPRHKGGINQFLLNLRQEAFLCCWRLSVHTWFRLCVSPSLNQPTKAARKVSPRSSPSIAHSWPSRLHIKRFALWLSVLLLFSEWVGNSKSRRFWQNSSAGKTCLLTVTWCHLLWEDQLMKGDVFYTLQGSSWCWRALCLSVGYSVTLEFFSGILRSCAM